MRIRPTLFVLLACGAGIIVGRSSRRFPSPDLTQPQAESKAGLDRIIGPIDCGKEAPTLREAIDRLRRRRAVRWVEAGRCASCGYDLRASAERCPECGLKFSRLD